MTSHEIPFTYFVTFKTLKLFHVLLCEYVSFFFLWTEKLSLFFRFFISGGNFTKQKAENILEHVNSLF